MSTEPYVIDMESFDERREAMLKLQQKGFEVAIPRYQDFERKVADSYAAHQQLPPQARPRFPKIVTEKVFVQMESGMPRKASENMKAIKVTEYEMERLTI